MSNFWKLVIMVACLYGAVVAFVYLRQSSLIYYPDMPGRDLVATPQQIGLEYQDVYFTGDDGIRLHGWFVPYRAARGTILFFHGNAGNVSHRLDSIDLLHRLGVNVFIIDYRGYGQSEGRVSERGTYRDAEAAWKYLTRTRGISEQRIIVFGRSLGASIAAWLASKYRPAGLILESGFASVTSMAKRIYPFLPVEWLSRFEYDTASYVKSVSCPILVAHSRNDEIIPFAEGRAVFDAAGENKQFLEMRGGHNDGYRASGRAYVEALGSFIHEKLERPATPQSPPD